MSTKSYPRGKRVGQQIQRALSELIRRELRDPRLGMITLTDVRMSSDLSYAKIYYSVLGADPHLAQQILEQYVAKVSFLELKGSFSSAMEAAAQMDKDKPGIL